MKSHHPFRTAAMALAAIVMMTGCETMPSGATHGLATLPSALGMGGTSRGVTSDNIRDVIEGASAALKDYSEEDQRRLGTEFSSVLLGARPLLRNDAVQRYVNQVGWWVALQSEHPKDKNGKEIRFAWRFGVIDSDAVNAYATPGGFVFVTVGLLRQLQSEAELAGVLGHEIAHVVRGHYLAAIKKSGFAQVAAGVVQANVGTSVLNSAVINAVRNIYTKGLDQSDEFDADQQGLLYAARAGYAPNGLPRVLNMYSAMGSSRDANFEMLFNTHPAPASRAARLQSLLTSKFAAAAQVTNETRFKAIKSQLK